MDLARERVPWWARAGASLRRAVRHCILGLDDSWVKINEAGLLVGEPYLPLDEMELLPAEVLLGNPSATDGVAPSPLTLDSTLRFVGGLQLGLAELADTRVLGRAVGAGTGVAQALTAAQVGAVVASASGGGTSNFFRADGSWAAPGGGGGGAADALRAIDLGGV